ncbi:hypothetical protein B5807_06828 [Epicoccum nigrum]|uniref:Uncharacterized protein n=1 Tax=Epicoccum nigrum TaxID=105696 RepID=A0A1Y2LYK8_EPING|nr:hypothetical protein B5807_06828 [Epicoccum nigrum]
MSGDKADQQPKGGDHIPTTNEPQDEEEQPQQGLLSKIGDPVGSVLGTALRPIGAPLEKGVTGPLGNALGGATRPALGPLMGEKEERSELLGGDNKDSYESRPEKIAGKEQTGDNPLGLDQTGRWGFQEDEEKK